MSQPSAVVPSEPIIQARGLARWYGPVIGLTDLDLDVPAGITGLLGSNGAGKSTLLRLLTGQILPSDGTLSVFGVQPSSKPAVFRRIGFCSEDDALFDDLNPLESVTFLARLSGMPRGEARERAQNALEYTGIAHAAARRCRGLSKGMRQRVRLAAALVHEPELLLLDEPMTGLDPVGRRDVVDIIQGFAEQGRSVLFSSHILHEVESIARHVVVLNRGMLLAEGSLAHIRECMSDFAFTLDVTVDDPRGLAALLARKEHVASLAIGDDGVLKIGSTSAKALLNELPGVLLDAGIHAREISCPAENLETLFRRLVR